MADRPPDLRFLVPLDGSDLATVSVPYLRALADEASEVVLLRVVPDPEPLTIVAGGAGDRVEHIVERNVDAAERYLEHVAAVLLNETDRVRIRTDVGPPHAAIARAAAEEDVDLIIMATHGRGFFGRAMVGSVADRLTRISPVPLMLIHPHERDIPARAQKVGNVRRLIVPLDGSELARHALPLAERLARGLDIPIRLLRAIDLQGEWVLGDDEHDADSLLEPMRQDTAETLQAEVQRLKDSAVRATFELTVGEVHKVIEDAVEPGDVIVMSSHGASGFRRWLLGSTAEKLIRSGIAPVVLVPVPERAAQTAPYHEA